MYYYCAKLRALKLPELSERVPAGSVIAASAMPLHQLTRRSFTIHEHVRHRMLDPQLYLAGLDPRTAKSTVFKLATCPWFGTDPPAYNSAQHGTLNDYKERFIAELLSRWTGIAPSTRSEIRLCVKSALQYQASLGCEALIIPSPLTSTATDYRIETEYLDAAIELASDLQLSIPLYATIAVSDALFRNADPTENTLIQAITGQIASRSEISGAYIVLEQTAETGYVCVNENTLFSLLILADDLIRGAARQVAVNYIGPFGAVLAAAGARVWASGYYRSQRRMRLADQEEDEGRAYPRFYSSPLAGDVGVEEDLRRLRDAGLLHHVFSRSEASVPLYNAIQANRYPNAAPQWEYRPGNIWAAAAHYNDIACKIEGFFDSKDNAGIIEAVDRWLKQASALANQVGSSGVSPQHTDTRHQAIWLSAFQKWRRYANC